MRDGCQCPAMHSHDPRQMEEHCDSYFIPLRWVAGKRLAGERYIMLEGLCGRCGNPIAQGVSLPAAAADTEYFALVYETLCTWRPFLAPSTRPRKSGTLAEQRAYWYREQDNITRDERKKLFLSLLGGNEDAQLWLDTREEET